MTAPTSVLARATRRERACHVALVAGVGAAAVVAGGAVWDLIVLAGLALDRARRRRGQRPICAGIDYGIGQEAWFETTPGREPYRSHHSRKLLARGDPAATAREIGSALAARLGVATMVIAMMAAAVDAATSVPERRAEAGARSPARLRERERRLRRGDRDGQRTANSIAHR